MICNPPREECWLSLCEECEDTKTLEDDLLSIFKALDIDEISYKQWQSTDRTELVTNVENTADFVQSLIEKLQVLKLHMFIHDMQTKQFYEVKENLNAGEVLAVGDFSENYSFVVQDAAQGVHWSKTSCICSTHGFVTTRRMVLSRLSLHYSSLTASHTHMTLSLCMPSKSVSSCTIAQEKDQYH